jgi:hypothetical protein
LTAGDRTRVPASAVLEVEEPEDSLRLDVAAAVEAGARAVRFTRVVRLARDEPLATLAALRLLREAAADGLPVTWHGIIGDEIDLRLLTHLAPPESVVGDRATTDLAEWRRRHRPGLCYYRLGPTFVAVKDVRRPDASARFRLDVAVDAFRALEAVVDLDGLDPPTLGLVDDLEEEALVLRFDRHATLLPNRMRRWPVPALDI